MFKTDNLSGDFWGGTAAMLVALPAAIAFGVTIYANIGGHYGAYGAIAGILGVAAMGVVASLMGGTDRLISAPSAPAAAVLSAFAMHYIAQDIGADLVFSMLMIVALLAGVFQVLFGVIGLGRLIKYMPFPVVSGYLSGVGLYIIAAQSPIFLGLPQGTHFWDAFELVSGWKWESIVVGAITIITMIYANKIMRSIPAVITALIVGMIAYGALGLVDPLLFHANNPFVIGELGGTGGINFIDSFIGRFKTIIYLNIDDITLLLFPALTLAALLSIDTLKTCVILDSMTHSFHNSNRELIAQGSGNVVSALIGGMPGSGTMGATMVNISSGAKTRLSGLIEGIMAVVAFVVLAGFIAWIPVASLAGILIVIGFRMIDKHSVKLLRSRQTMLDFFIIVSVAITALSVSLIAAAGVGLVLAVVLYIIQQIGASVVYRYQDGTEARSKIVRGKEEEMLLCDKGEIFSVYELHGSLFFGTANQLYTMLQEDLQHKKYIIMDMKRVQNVDLTAAHILLQIKDILHERDGYLLLCRLPHKLPTGDDMESYFNHVGLLKHLSPIKVFDDLDDAIEWAENKIIKEGMVVTNSEEILDLSEFDLFEGRKEQTIEELRTLVEVKSYKKGETIYSEGEGNGEIFLIRRGSVRVMLPYAGRKSVHLNTIGRNNFFGEFSFLEGAPHYTDTVAASDTELYSISRDAFEQFSLHHKKTALHFMQSLAAVLAERLRLTRSELGEEYDV
ncbi:MAG: cyclic nucleotide-binding protein [Sulfuricurvum sp. PD_MW2]|jgi:SulP family sulfate permease|uniref:SulP family inorganic anion transporter n=1 Tax=Sulfuricurvum sp. PD_MW2 TaxID=2027917 RepID=UPI000C060782|nr:SulP family inorganic anion transporter [Sulfuricurvum sp. PD_MW2]PHM17305.1 MAG: cyclic nucleotide-binding protein [Sulfuricurvum sp. PD_MW2]